MKDYIGKVAKEISSAGRKTFLATAVGLGGLAALVGGNAEAGVINIYPTTSDPTNVGATNLSLRDDGGSSYYGIPFMAGKKNPELEISSMDPGFRSKLVDAPQYTDRFTFDLAIGPYSSSKVTTGPLDEILNFQITDTTDLDEKYVVVCNLVNSSIPPYIIPQDYNFHTLTLPGNIPNNQSGASGAFDSWELNILPAMPGDANLDGSVNGADLNTVLSNFNQTGDWSKGDFNSDGTVNGADLNTVLSNFNQSYDIGVRGSNGVPEPSGLALLVAAGIAGAGVGYYSRRRKENHVAGVNATAGAWATRAAGNYLRREEREEEGLRQAL